MPLAGNKWRVRIEWMDFRLGLGRLSSTIFPIEKSKKRPKMDGITQGDPFRISIISYYSIAPDVRVDNNNDICFMTLPIE